MLSKEEIIRIGEELRTNHTEIEIYKLESEWLKNEYANYKLHNYPSYISICVFIGTPNPGGCPVDSISITIGDAVGGYQQCRIDFEGNFWERGYHGNWSAYKEMSSEDAENIDTVSKVLENTSEECVIITKKQWTYRYPDGTVIGS